MAFGRRTLIKVIVLGDSGVGKTSLLNQYVRNGFSNQHQATIGASFLTKELQIDDKLLTLQIWDTAGQERFHSLESVFFRGADCCVLVYDVNVMMSFENLEKWRDVFLMQANILNPEKFPFVVLGNKIDVNGGNSRVVSEKKARAWSTAKGNVLYVETSAKDNVNVDVAFLYAAEKALNLEAEEEIYFPDVIHVASRKPERASTCAC